MANIQLVKKGKIKYRDVEKCNFKFHSKSFSLKYFITPNINLKNYTINISITRMSMKVYFCSGNKTSRNIEFDADKFPNSKSLVFHSDFRPLTIDLKICLRKKTQSNRLLTNCESSDPHSYEVS